MTTRDTTLAEFFKTNKRKLGLLPHQAGQQPPPALYSYIHTMASQISIGAFYSTLHKQIGVYLHSDSDSNSGSGSDSPGTRTREQKVLNFIQRAQNNNNISTLSTPLNGFLWKASVIKPNLEPSIMNFVDRFSSMFSVSSDSNMEVIRACASFLSLSCNPSPKEDEIWDAITNLLHAAAASLPQPDPDTPPLSATFPSSPQLPASVRIHRQVQTPPPHVPEESQGRVNTSHITPRKPPPEVVDDTPFRANSGFLFSNSGQTHDEVDPYLRAELRDTVFRDVHGFHNFFPGITQEEWNCAVNCPGTCSCQWSDALHNNTIAPDLIAPFPSQPHPPERSVMDWFTQFNQILLSRKFCGSGSRPLGDSRCVRQCDVFLTPTATDPVRHSWLEVLVPGELKASPIKDGSPDTIVQLAGYVREVFGAQVNRRFVHGFTICGSLFRCYLFDRSGVSISNRFNIRKNTKTHNLLIRILSGYSTMSEQQLGFDTNYTDANGMPFIPSRSLPCPTHLSYNGRRFRLISKLFHRPVIVSRGTVCWLAEDLLSGKECVVKDSWRAGWRISEGDLLTIAEGQGVWGVPKALVYGDVTIPCAESIVEDRICVLRSHLSYSPAARIVLAERHVDGIHLLSSAMIKPVTESSIAIPGVSRSKKRASVDQLSSNKSKLAKIETNKPSSVHSTPTENVNALSQNAPAGSTQRKLSSAGSRGSQSSTNNPTNQNRSSVGLKASQLSSSSILISPGTDLNPISNPPKSRFMDLTHSIIVSIPVGKRIDQFDSIQELLEAFRDAIRCRCIPELISLFAALAYMTITRSPIPSRSW